MSPTVRDESSPRCSVAPSAPSRCDSIRLSFPHDIVWRQPDTGEFAPGISELNKDRHSGIQPERIAIDPLFAVVFPNDSSTHGDETTVRQTPLGAGMNVDCPAQNRIYA